MNKAGILTNPVRLGKMQNKTLSVDPTKIMCSERRDTDKYFFMIAKLTLLPASLSVESRSTCITRRSFDDNERNDDKRLLYETYS